MLVWSFTNTTNIPTGVLIKDYVPEEYMVRRTNEALQMRTGEEYVTKERPGILDTGRHIAELKRCQGGFDFYNQLIQRDWKIADIWYEVRESENSKLKNRKHTKIRVNMVLSRDPKKTVEEPKGLKHLLKTTWIAHVWDNTRTPKNNFVIHFTFMQLRIPPQVIIVPLPC